MQHDVRIRNNVRVTGNGPETLMFAHGFGCDQVMWRFVVPAFADRYRIVLFDYVGAGHSDLSAYDPERYRTLDGYASDILEICEALALRDVVLVAHSVSATIGMLAAIRAPQQFSRLLMVGPSPCYLNDPPDYLGGFDRPDLLGLLEMMEKNFNGWAGALAPVIVGNTDHPEHAQELEASFCATDPTIASQFAAATFLSDYRADAVRLPIPSLIMQCSQDAIAPETVGRWLSTHVPMSTFVGLKATGHCPHLTHPAETIDVMNAYLGESRRSTHV